MNIGIAGLGTVGRGTLNILNDSRALLENRTGNSLEVSIVCARDKSRDRGIDLSRYKWVDDGVEIANDTDVDIVVELIGGSEGVAYDMVETALKNGKHVVTANKALVAHHGAHLAELAEQNNVILAYEAAVAGGIPVIKTVKEALAGNNIKRIHGILNGTCNYMLTVMEETGQSFDVILKEAQEKGYAEADPTFDVDGIDASHKLAILTSLAFGTKVNLDAVFVEGIRNITPEDIEYAKELGYKIKLLGICEPIGDKIMQRVHPVLINEQHPLYHVSGVDNGVFIEGDQVGNIMLRGPGAGEQATASAVVSDIADIASKRTSPTFSLPTSQLTDIAAANIHDLRTSYYLRLGVEDKPGVLADITQILSDEGISMESFLQKASTSDEIVQLVGTTHETTEEQMKKAIAKLETVDAVKATIQLIRIEN